MNKSTLDNLINNEVNRLEKEKQELNNKSDLAYLNKQMFYRLHKKWEMEHYQIEKRINQLHKELHHIKNPY